MLQGILRLVATVLAVVVAVATPAAAGGDGGRASVTEGGLTLTAEAGYHGAYLPGRRLPVRVSITADRLLRGRIEVVVPDQAATFSTPVEVPGGSDKDVLLAVPTPAMFEVRDVRVRLLIGDEALVVEPRLRRLEDEQLVGLLPGTAPADLPGALSLPMEAGTARFVALDELALATPGSLDPLGTITAGPDELGRLDAGSRRAVLDWVDQGGHLVVDAPAGTEIAGLPEAWQPTGASPTRRRAGLGEVRLAAGAIAAERWADVVEPTSTATAADLNELGGMSVPVFESTSDAVARDAGLQALELGWLLGFLLLYVLVAGPVAWLVLRRRRPALGWVVVPAVAVAFTLGSFAIGADLRAGTRSAHGSVLELSDVGNRVTATIGAVSRSGADSISTFPAGWTGGAVDTSLTGGLGGPRVAVVTDGTTTEATLPLAAGGYGVVRGGGPAPDLEGGLVIDARVEDGLVVGTVENTLPFAVHEVVVFSGRHADPVGSLEPGETADLSLRGNEMGGNGPWSIPEEQLWQPFDPNTGRPRTDSPVNLAVWADYLLAAGPNARTRGDIVVVGWTRDFTPEVEVTGQGLPTGRTAVIGRASVSTDGDVAPGASRRELVRGPRGVELPDEEVDFAATGSIWRFTAPDAATGPLAFDVPGYIGRLDVWDGTSWVPVFESDGEAARNGNFGVLGDAPLPAGVTGPVVWVRGWQIRDMGAFDGIGLDLVSAEVDA